VLSVEELRRIREYTGVQAKRAVFSRSAQTRILIRSNNVNGYIKSVNFILDKIINEGI